MPTNYIYGTVLTGEYVAANNRGDNIGNTTTLQKVFHLDDVHTSVSAEAIRFALRYRFQLEDPEQVNRSYDSTSGKLHYVDEKRAYWNSGKTLIDDDIMGFMDAAAAKKERDEDDDEFADDEAKPKAKKAKAKGTTTIRQSPLAIGRAVSLRPYRGELSFNCVSGAKEKGKLSLYNAEMHTTEYQYSFGLNLNDVVDKSNIGCLLQAIIDPPAVGGNHSRFSFDFSPKSIVLRLTHAHSSRIQNCFEHDDVSRTACVAKLVERVRSGDIPPNELIVGGEIAGTDGGKELAALGAKVHYGIKAAMTEAINIISTMSPSFKDVDKKIKVLV